MQDNYDDSNLHAQSSTNVKINSAVAWVVNVVGYSQYSDEFAKFEFKDESGISETKRDVFKKAIEEMIL